MSVADDINAQIIMYQIILSKIEERTFIHCNTVPWFTT